MERINRSVQQLAEKVSLHKPPHSNTANKINQQTWPVRYRALTSAQGYNTGRHTLRATPIETWLTIANKSPAYWFIDAGFLYAAIRMRKLYLNFTQLSASHILTPINYFATYFSEHSTLFRLFNLLNKLGCYHMMVKESPPPVDVDGWSHSLHNILQQDTLGQDARLRRAVQEIAWQADNRTTLDTVAPEMIVRLLELAWDDELNPALDHAVIISHNPQLVPAIEQLTKMGIIVTGVITREQTVSNHFLAQFTHLIDLHELLHTCGVLEPAKHLA